MDETEIPIEEDGIESYSGRCYWIRLHGGEATITTFPNWVHEVILGDNSIVKTVSEDLQQGMALQIQGMCVLIDQIEEGLYHGMLEGNFIGEQQFEEDTPVERKSFIRTIYENGKIDWSVDLSNQLKCPVCGKEF
jgi:hypothetical protein